MDTSITDQTKLSNVDRLLKPEDVASVLNISRSFTYHLLQTGQLPAIRLGRSVRVRRQDLESFIGRNLHGQEG